MQPFEAMDTLLDNYNEAMRARMFTSSLLKGLHVISGRLAVVEEAHHG